jgi:hypothetical protein
VSVALGTTVDERVITGLAELVRGLALSGEAGLVNGVQEVYEETLPARADLVFPSVLVSSLGEQPEEGEYSTFEEEHVVYPVRVLFLDQRPAQADAWEQRRGVYKRWRYQVAHAARGLTRQPLLTGVPEAFKVEPGRFSFPPADTAAAEFCQAGVLLEVHTNEPRAKGGGG